MKFGKSLAIDTFGATFWPEEGLFRWWSTAMLRCLPAGLRRFLGSRTGRLLIAPRGASAFVSLNEGDDVTTLRPLLLESLTRDALPSNFKPKRHGVEVQMEAAAVLRRRIWLPMETEKNLDRVVEMELDRFSPFAADQVYFDYRVLRRDGTQSRIELELAMVPKSVADPWLSALDAVGVAAETLTAEDTWHGTNMLPRQNRSRRAGPDRLNLLLGLIAAVLIVTLMVIPLVKKRELVLQIEDELALARRQAAAVMALSEQKDERLAEARFVLEKRLNSHEKTRVIAELTRLLPDDTWVQYLEIKGMQMKVRGESAQASALIGLLESSELFADTRFESPVVQVARTGGERFHVAARILPPVLSP